VRLEDADDLAYHRKKHPDAIIQEFVAGTEVTVDVFCGADGVPRVVSPRVRLATKAGQSTKGVTIDPAPFAAPVKKICTELKLIGVSNFQFIVPAKGEPVLIEVNPRFAAGGLMLTVRAGANLPWLVLKSALGMPVSPEECRVRPGVRMSRFWDEVYWDEGDHIPEWGR